MQMTILDLSTIVLVSIDQLSKLGKFINSFLLVFP